MATVYIIFLILGTGSMVSTSQCQVVRGLGADVHHITTTGSGTNLYGR